MFPEATSRVLAYLQVLFWDLFCICLLKASASCATSHSFSSACQPLWQAPGLVVYRQIFFPFFKRGTMYVLKTNSSKQWIREKKQCIYDDDRLLKYFQFLNCYTILSWVCEFILPHSCIFSIMGTELWPPFSDFLFKHNYNLLVVGICCLVLGQE